MEMSIESDPLQTINQLLRGEDLFNKFTWAPSLKWLSGSKAGKCDIDHITH